MHRISLLALLLVTSPLFSAEVIVSTDRPLATFNPAVALGATIDAHTSGENAQIFTEKNIDAMLSAGFGPLSYRLATELAGEAWHWNPSGTWSDPARGEGYWTSSDDSAAPIMLSYGYRLPRRGNTIDQSLNDGYSRIDDGDESTFWKSNPYLDEHFAGEPHPQWMFFDLRVPRRVSAAKIVWGEPYATRFRLQYWSGDDPINMPKDGQWIDFDDHSREENAHGGTTLTRFKSRSVRWVRVLMTESSHTSHRDTRDIRDIRDSLGFSVREVFIGSIASDGTFRDVLRHGKNNKEQTIVWVSSTDPWHRAADRDPELEQLGLDTVYQSRLTRGLPMLTPVALLYGTPEDAAAELRYMQRRRHPISYVEMGEEPNGQNMSPEDYGALYRQWARAIHAVDPSLRLGGPAFQSTIAYVGFWPDASGTTSWIGRFVDDLRAHDQLADFAFFSFEWYPFDNVCVSPGKQLLDAHTLLPPLLARWKREGLPSNIPWLVTEYGWSSYAAEAEVDLYGALFNAEFIGQFLSSGGAAAYLYGLEPDQLMSEKCDKWGNLILLQSDDAHRILHRVATYWEAVMLTHDWAAGTGEHTLYETRVRGGADISAYAVKRPDGTWSVMVINKSDRRAVDTTIAFRGANAGRSKEVEIVQLSRAEYAWHAAGERGHPARSLPPSRRVQADGRAVHLPPLSLTIVSGSTDPARYNR